MANEMLIAFQSQRCAAKKKYTDKNEIVVKTFHIRK